MNELRPIGARFFYTFPADLHDSEHGGHPHTWEYVVTGHAEVFTRDGSLKLEEVIVPIVRACDVPIEITYGTEKVMKLL